MGRESYTPMSGTHRVLRYHASYKQQYRNFSKKGGDVSERYPFCEQSNHGNKKKRETLATNDWRDMSMEALLTIFGREMKEGIEMRLGKEGNSCNESAGAMML